MRTMSPEKGRRLQDAFHRARTFSGWTFSDMKVTTLGADLPWNYDALGREAAVGASRVLDLDTGGGERIQEITRGLPARVVATEQWGLNAPVAGRRLRPLDIAVVRSAPGTDTPLPFRAKTFDLVLNRHGAIAESEIARVLVPGGTFLTQQVDPADWPELVAYFPRIADHGYNHYEQRAAAFQRLGFAVTARRHDYTVAYGGLEDLVYNLAVASWTIPGFSFERDLDALLELEAAHTTPVGLVLTRALYLLTAVKPAS